MRLRAWLMVWVLIPGSALSQAFDDAKFCGGPVGTVVDQLLACTRAIASGALSNENLAITYFNRGREYRLKGETDRAIDDYTQALSLNSLDADSYVARGEAWVIKGDSDRAIADLNEAIRLNPQYAMAYTNRAKAWRVKYEYDRAIADDSEAIRLNPQDASSRFARGVAEFLIGRLDAAAEDFATAGRIDDEYRTYAAIWVYMTGEREGNRDRAASQLQAAYPGIDKKAWPAPVVELLLGRSSPDAVFWATTAPDARARAEQRCEANFHVGMYQLSRDARTEGLARLQNARNQCPKTFVEYSAAASEFVRFGGLPGEP
jgi:lipoprotein NlpI